MSLTTSEPSRLVSAINAAIAATVGILTLIGVLSVEVGGALTAALSAWILVGGEWLRTRVTPVDEPKLTLDQAEKTEIIPNQTCFPSVFLMPKKEKTLQDMMLELTASMRQTAASPTIVAYKPLPHQDKFHKSKAKGKLFIGGNRSGKTVGGGVETVKRLTGRHERTDLPRPPVRGRAIGVDFIQGVEKIIIPEIKKWLPPSYYKNGSWEDSYDKQARTLHLTNNSTLEFMSYEQELDKHAGTSRHFVWFDEEPPLPIFNENMLRLADVDGDFWITMTPLIDMSWTFDRLYEPGRKGELKDIEVFEVSTLENTYIKENVLERLTLAMDLEDKQARTKPAGDWPYRPYVIVRIRECHKPDRP